MMMNVKRSQMAASFLASLLLAGCGADTARPLVEGAVHFNGAPLGNKTLNLCFSDSNGESFSQRIPIRADGTFAGEVPVPGTYTIVIEESLAVQEGVKVADKDAPKIPAKYKDAAASDLKWNIQKGKNKQDFNLVE